MKSNTITMPESQIDAFVNAMTAAVIGRPVDPAMVQAAMPAAGAVQNLIDHPRPGVTIIVGDKNMNRKGESYR